MHQIRWTAEAKSDANEIIQNVAEYASIESAMRYLDEFDRLLHLAAQFPKMGKPRLNCWNERTLSD